MIESAYGHPGALGYQNSGQVILPNLLKQLCSYLENLIAALMGELLNGLGSR